MEVFKNIEGLTELDNAQALRINGGDGETPATTSTDNEEVCKDETHLGNTRERVYPDGSTVTETCIEKPKKKSGVGWKQSVDF